MKCELFILSVSKIPLFFCFTLESILTANKTSRMFIQFSIHRFSYCVYVYFCKSPNFRNPDIYVFVKLKFFSYYCNTYSKLIFYTILIECYIYIHSFKVVFTMFILKQLFCFSIMIKIIFSF